MPSSPASTSKARSPARSVSNTKTKRSTVSTAFNTGGPSATAPTQTGSAVIYATSAKDRSVSGKASSPGSSAQRTTSVVTMGTVTDPDATASQLLATKSPHMMAGGSNASVARSPSVAMASKLPSAAAPSVSAGTPSVSAGTPSVSAAAPSVSAGAAAASSLAGAGSTKGGPPPPSVSQGSVKSPPAHPASTSQPAGSSMVPASSMADGQASAMADAQPVGHGLIDVTVRTGAKFEMAFSAVGCILFAILWVYMLSTNCYRDDYWIFFTKAFSALGVIACLFVLFHSCFERRFAIGRGVFGCIIFFILAVIIFLNLVDAFMAMNCICKCSGGNAFSSRQTEDLIIFGFSLAGALTLIAVLLVSSVSHEEHHHQHHHTNQAQVAV